MWNNLFTQGGRRKSRSVWSFFWNNDVPPGSRDACPVATYKTVAKQCAQIAEQPPMWPTSALIRGLCCRTSTCPSEELMESQTRGVRGVRACQQRGNWQQHREMTNNGAITTVKTSRNSEAMDLATAWCPTVKLDTKPVDPKTFEPDETNIPEREIQKQRVRFWDKRAAHTCVSMQCACENKNAAFAWHIYFPISWWFERV